MSRAPVNAKPLPSVPSYLQHNQLPSRMNSTIRTVTSSDDRHRLSDDSSPDGTPSHSTSRGSGFSSSVNSTVSMASSSQDHTQTPIGKSRASPNPPRTKPSPSTAQDSFLDIPKPNTTRPSVEIPQRESSLSAMGAPATPQNGHEHPRGGDEPAWDSTVGKAGLGKTGRVINKLVSDNEQLRRELNVERTRAEDAKQAARLLEDKLERIVSDYESRLLEANVTKALLARKERQVETLQASVELERKRAVDAGDRERVWKDEMERGRADAKRTVDEATNQAALLEGRYNAISSHWRDQGDEVRKSMVKMRREVAALLEERKKDDDRIGTLRELCDQQDGNIRGLTQQKEDIAAQFDRYKAEQEEALREIKSKAALREEEQERTLEEAREVLSKLKWALSVKEKVDWAQ
ncbi:hypothetical protein B0T18DRAFT_411495 [Schizothecium vesticola]|uniref:SWI5-dependent HO expression protein 3 n=1 Tax=Schizothecium vesticola TaxID=314040 RepID=A0AA40EVL9_9PEZI|nr:hypothetical protein B0T18DRAFT_411495 [Schizothecium vesticola]